MASAGAVSGAVRAKHFVATAQALPGNCVRNTLLRAILRKGGGRVWGCSVAGEGAWGHAHAHVQQEAVVLGRALQEWGKAGLRGDEWHCWHVMLYKPEAEQDAWQ